MVRFNTVSTRERGDNVMIEDMTGPGVHKLIMVSVRGAYPYFLSAYLSDKPVTLKFAEETGVTDYECDLMK